MSDLHLVVVDVRRVMIAYTFRMGLSAVAEN